MQFATRDQISISKSLKTLSYSCVRTYTWNGGHLNILVSHFEKKKRYFSHVKFFMVTIIKYNSYLSQFFSVIIIIIFLLSGK